MQSKHTLVLSPVASAVQMKWRLTSTPQSPHVTFRSCATSFSSSSMVNDGSGVAVLVGGAVSTVGGSGYHAGGGGVAAGGGFVALPLSKSK